MFLASWPKYEAPEWKYRNLTAESNGASLGETRFEEKCSFWNHVLPSFLEKVECDEDVARRKRRQNEDEDEDVDFSVCK